MKLKVSYLFFLWLATWSLLHLKSGSLEYRWCGCNLSFTLIQEPSITSVLFHTAVVLPTFTLQFLYFIALSFPTLQQSRLVKTLQRLFISYSTCVKCCPGCNSVCDFHDAWEDKRCQAELLFPGCMEWVMLPGVWKAAPNRAAAPARLPPCCCYIRLCLWCSQGVRDSHPYLLRAAALSMTVSCLTTVPA